MQPFVKKVWPYENEPVYLEKEEYCLSYMPITGVPFWEESDNCFRERIKKELEK